MEYPQWARQRSRIDVFGVGGALLGLLATLYISFVLQITVSTKTSTSTGSIEQTTASETVYHGVLSMFVSGDSGGAAVLVWPLVIAIAAVVGGVATWKRYRAGVWISAITLTSIAILGILSFGALVAPAAAGMLLAAGLLQVENGARTASNGHDSGIRSPWIDHVGSLVLHRDVLLLFLALAGPLTLLEVFDLNATLLSILALPGYIAIALIGVVLAATGLENVLGRTAIYAVNVVWLYLLSLAIVLGSRTVIDRRSN